MDCRAGKAVATVVVHRLGMPMVMVMMMMIIIIIIIGVVVYIINKSTAFASKAGFSLLTYD